MGTLTYSHTLVAGTPENINDVQDMFNDAKTVINGNINDANLASTTKDKLSLSDGSVVRRGKSIIVTEEARTNVAYGTLATPDQITNLVLPTDGLICVFFQAMWKESVAGAARAAVFVGANQLKVAPLAASGGTAPAVQEAATASAQVNTYWSMTSNSAGLRSEQGDAAAAYTGDVTTGQSIAQQASGSTTYSGGPCYIFAVAGTYNITVQWKASSGSVTAKERKLWALAIGF